MPTTGAARRLRLVTIVTIIVIAALTMLSVTQRWWSLALQGGKSLDVAGTVASPALSALALSSFALAAALTIAGPAFRVILGVLEAFIGFTVGLAAISSLADPTTASATVISAATGVAGKKSIAALVSGVSDSAWPWVGIVSGVLALLAGIFLLATFRRWPAASRKYQAVRLIDPNADPNGQPASSAAGADGDGAGAGDAGAGIGDGEAAADLRDGASAGETPRDPVGDWDALSDGTDPTAR
jgi:hypothetical protein